MPVSLSKTELYSFEGDVLPLYLEDGEADLSAADVTWACVGDAVQIRRFAEDPLTPFSHGVLVTLKQIGTGTVTATYEGNTYTCSVTVRARKTGTDGPLHFYRGDLHTHTVTTHTPAKFDAIPHAQAPCIQTLGADERMDFGILSDHASVMRRRGFFNGFVELYRDDPTGTVIFPGSESEVTVLENDRFGLPHKHSGEIVILGAENCSFAKSWEEFEADLSPSVKPVGIFAHPFVLGVGQNSLWSFPFHKINTPHMLSLMHGIEMGGGSSLLSEYAYFGALDAGFHLSPVSSSDCHGPNWGFDAVRGKTILLASEKSREAFHSALLAGRFYASESGNVKLSCTVNGAALPATLPLTDTYRFHVKLDLFDDLPDTIPTHLAVISDGGETVYECAELTSEFEFTLHSDTARYFYLRLWDENGRKTWSPAVWTGREFDAAQDEKTIIPLNGCDFTATEVQSGADAALVLDGDPHTAFESEYPTPSILIDMKKERRICAIGYWARRFTKDWIKATSVDWKAEIGGRMQDIIKRYVTAYEIHTSLDGVHFELVKKGAIRAFGDEAILHIPPHGARYVRFDVTATAGKNSKNPTLAQSPAAIGELTVFEEG